MSIIRINHNGANPYSMINNISMWDENLPLEVVGLWVRCLSKPNDWNFNVKNLSQTCGISEDTMNKYINILIANGYALRFQKKENGRYSSYEYVFFEFKLTDKEKELYHSEFQKMFPQPKFPAPVLPAPVNLDLLNTEAKLSTEREQQQPAAAAAVFSCLKNENRLTKSDIDWLMKFTEAEVEEALKYTQQEADQGKIKTTFSQTIKWAIKEKPKRTAKVDAQENKSIAHAFEDQWVSPYYRLDCCGDSAMIIALGAQMEPKVLSYEEPDFINKLKSLLAKMGFTPRDSG